VARGEVIGMPIGGMAVWPLAGLTAIATSNIDFVCIAAHRLKCVYSHRAAKRRPSHGGMLNFTFNRTIGILYSAGNQSTQDLNKILMSMQ
jgi:hypothetical protein